MDSITEFNQLCTSTKPFQEKGDRLIKLLSETLGIKKVGEIKDDELCFYIMDMSNYKIKVSSRTLFVVPNPELCKDGLQEDMIEKIKEVITLGLDFPGEEKPLHPDKFNEQVNFIFYPNDGRIFKSLYDDPGYNIILFGRRTISEVIEAKSPHKLFIKIARERLNLSKLSPYKYLGPVGEEMFYGRKTEIEAILNSEKSFAVVGSRGTGKTSLLSYLLKEMEKKYLSRKAERRGFPVALLNCLNIYNSEWVIERMIPQVKIDEWRRWEKRKEKGEGFCFRSFLRRTSQWHGCKIILLLDEVDNLTVGGFFSDVRAACDEGNLRVIVSGYKDLYEAVMAQDGPLYNLLEPIRLKGLKREEAEPLILEPMRELGISFNKEKELVSYLLKQSGSYPKIIQFYCQHLLERLEEKRKNTITMADVHAVETSDDTINHFGDIFMEGATDVEKLFVYIALGLSERFRTEDLHQRLNQRLKEIGVPISIEMVDREIKHLELSNIFERSGDEAWFAYPILFKILKRYSVEYRINELMKNNEVISKLRRLDDRRSSAKKG